MTTPAATNTVLAGAAVAVFLWVRAILAPWGVAGVAVAEWIGLGLLPWAWLRGRGRTLRGALGSGPAGTPQGEASVRGPGLTLPSGRGAAGAVLLGLSGLTVAWLVSWLQAPWLQPGPGVAEALREQLLARSPGRLLLLLAAAALTPALLEELVFRGFLLRALLSWWPPGVAIGAAGLAFGWVHWVPGGGFRVLPTAALGILLGWAAWRSGSVVTAMIAHGVHNTVLLAGAWAGAAGVRILGPLAGVEAASGAPPPPGLLVLGLASLAGGVHLLRIPVTDLSQQPPGETP